MHLPAVDGKFIYPPKGPMLKVKAKQKERAIRLSDMGKTLLPDLFQVPHPLPLTFLMNCQVSG